MTQRDFIVIGTSSGGVDALRSLASQLPADIPASIAVVLHIGAHGSMLPTLLNQAGPLPAKHAQDGERYAPGRIYVAPPDRHLVVDDGQLRLVHGAKENFARPAIDPLFRSAAAQIGPRAIGVILTGLLDDGAAGLEAIQACGGATLVQDPVDAFASEMPRHASPFADHVLPLDQMGRCLVKLTSANASAPGQNDRVRREATDRIVLEHSAWLNGVPPFDPIKELATPSTFTCPECNGTLWRITGSRVIRYRCHIGHAYSAASLDDGLSVGAEDSLRQALRALREREMFSRERSDHFAKTGDTAAQQREQDNALRAGRAAELLQSMLMEK
ncbi:two-component system chemotaxis response regulator CheB [Paraburkholderia sp. WC7.3g]|uniref:protein-glutamate methylesterase n=1 Tax=Paraburkholderia podalyriae TaxID=1938811 RepID=A0ABR7PM98_9BURK|nr:chemotaxis protein CheB [Paraburkholderia podalyriae]MBC8747510.1 chemotaxis protein CheB [Paraburkholderia podalyriae]